MENKNVVPLIETDYYACGNKKQWDSSKVCNALLGSWLWDFTKFPESGKKSLNEANYKLVFAGDSKLFFYNNNVFFSEVTWNIKGEDNGFGLFTEPMIESAYGTIYFCEDKMEH